MKTIPLAQGKVALVDDDKRSHHIGYFASEETAAKAYDQAAKQRFGTFALTNF